MASLFSGYLVNKTSNTKPALIISRILAICSTFIYFGIEFNATSAIYLMIAYQLLMGISFGFGNVFRTHIAMATKESERSKGYGLSNLSYSLGTIIGPLLQLIFSLIHFPGLKLLFGLHFNLYTASVYLALFTSIIGLLALIFFFYGNLKVLPKKAGQDEIIVATENNTSTINLKEAGEIKIDKIDKNIKYDKIAVCVLIYAKCVHETITLILFSIPERIALMIAIGLFICFFGATFPWPFISQKIPYEHVQNGTAFFKRNIF
uniref:Major facilitator superfamily (MFS) profile domain-containing protein n=1 Tax=Panagrolaimus superbus TaxID=310955 RepID=A0A914Y6X7_9BILA